MYHEVIENLTYVVNFNVDYFIDVFWFYVNSLSFVFFSFLGVKVGTVILRRSML